MCYEPSLLVWLEGMVGTIDNCSSEEHDFTGSPRRGLLWWTQLKYNKVEWIISARLKKCLFKDAEAMWQTE